MLHFDVTSTKINGLVVIRRKPIGDDRGFLSRLFCEADFAALGLVVRTCQINHTMTRRKGTIRGMHFQHPPHGEIKLVTCLRGMVFDVAVDLRKGSPTFLQWHGEVLSAETPSSIYIPRGFAHGFQTMTHQCELLYAHSDPYQPASEDGLNALDPSIAIRWPLPPTDMSERDRTHAHLTPNFRGIEA
jgi:dTDP-4-dehydrorhamnose 3,5-epimerase